MLKACRLRSGDTIGIVSPSFGAAGLFPHRLEQGIRQVEAMGFHARLAPHARGVHSGYLSGSAEQRAQDLHELFLDPEVSAIVTAIGGDHANQLLPLLDFDLVRTHPKIFMGYSDNTVLHLAFWRAAGLVTFSGPALITEFAEQPRMFAYTERYLRRALCRAEPVGEIEPAKEWTDEFLDWQQQKDLERPRILNPSPGWSWLKPGEAQGPLLGGCLESLDHLRGTPFWPDWRGAIFFFETSEEKPPPERVDSILMDYENMGVLAQIAGMIVGRPIGYSHAEKRQLDEVIRERTAKFSFPVITGMDFGHTAPQFTLPLGCQARIDGRNRRFAIVEAAVTE